MKPYIIKFFSILISWCLYSSVQAEIANPSPPAIAARAFLLMDTNSNQILAETDADTRIEPASLTKLMTAYITFSELRSGTITLQTETTISNKAWRMEGSRTFLEVNKKVPVEILLKGMIIQSGNDATIALAELLGGNEENFVAKMNEQAHALGMQNTHFTNSTGLNDPEHYSTVRDLAILARHLVKNFPEYYKLYSIKDFTYNGITQYNRNKLLWSDLGVDGIKTGHTNSAGYCLIASSAQGDMRLISVVVKTKSENARADESAKLISWGLRSFETHKLYTANQPLTKARIWKGDKNELPLGLSDDLYITLPKGQYNKLSASMSVMTDITAPAAKGQPFGTVNINLEGKKITQRPLTALQDVDMGNIVGRMIDEVMLWF